MAENKEIGLSLKLDGKDADVKVKSFKAQLKEANNELITIVEKFGATSVEAANAAKKVAQLKDAIGDAKDLANAFNLDKKFAAVTGALQGVTGGFAALQGVIGLTGTESEDLQKQLLKVQSAMALADGLNAVTASKDAFINLASVVKSNVVKAFSSLKAALISTGIGALVVGLGLLVANFDKVKQAVLNLIPGLGSVFSFFGKLIDKVTDFIGVTNAASRALDKLKSDAEKRLKETERFLDLNADKYDQYTQKKLNADKDYQKKRLDLLKDESLNEEQRNYFLRQALEQRNRAIDAADKDRSTAFDKAQEELARKAEEAFKKSEEKRKKLEEEARKAFEELEKNNLQRKGFKAEGSNASITQDAVAIAEQEARDAKEKADKELTDKILANQQRVLSGQSSAAIKAIELANMEKDEKIRIKQAEHDAQVALLQAIADATGALSRLIGQQTVAGKVLAIAEATINTYLGASKAIAQGGLLGAIQAGAVIAAGLAQVKNIISVQVPSVPGASTPSAPSGGSIPSAPIQPELSQSAAINQAAFNTQGNAAVRAYVVDRDVSSNQEREQRLARAAKMG